MKKIFISLSVLFLILNITSCAVPPAGHGKAKDSPSKNASDFTEFESSSTDSALTSSSSTSSQSASSISSAPGQAASIANSSPSAVSSAQSSAPSEIKITDISLTYCRTMFLDSRGNVYLAGRDMYNSSKSYSKAKKIFENAKSICADDEDIFLMLSVVDVNNNYLAMGTAPDSKKYSKFTKIMADVKKAGKGLILKQDNSLYIWGEFKDKYNDGSILELDLNAKTPQLFMSDVKDFYGTYLHGYAIKNNGDLYTWGTVSNGFKNYGFIPFKIASDVREAGMTIDEEWYVTKTGGTLYHLPIYTSVSYHGDGPEKANFPSPVKIADNVKTAFLNSNSPAYITENNELFMWGLYNTPPSQYGKNKGNGMETGTPEKVAEDVLQVGTWYNNAYLDMQGILTTFGANQSGKLGIGKQDDYFTKEKHVVLKNIIKMYYEGSIFAINRSGEVFMWGDNMSILGGTGNHARYISTPQKVLFE